MRNERVDGAPERDELKAGQEVWVRATVKRIDPTEGLLVFIVDSRERCGKWTISPKAALTSPQVSAPGGVTAEQLMKASEEAFKNIPNPHLSSAHFKEMARLLNAHLQRESQPPASEWLKCPECGHDITKGHDANCTIAPAQAEAGRPSALEQYPHRAEVSPGATISQCGPEQGAIPPTAPAPLDNTYICPKCNQPIPLRVVHVVCPKPRKETP
jgi:hypothetical protein